MPSNFFHGFTVETFRSCQVNVKSDKQQQQKNDTTKNVRTK